MGWSYTKCCTTVWSDCPCTWHKTADGKSYAANNRTYTNMGCNCQSWAHSTGIPDTCKAGYFQSSITKRCHKNCPAGYTNTGETCYRGPSTGGLGSMHCKFGVAEGHIKEGVVEEKWGGRCFIKDKSCYDDGEKDAGLCYPKCEKAFSGVGPVCWQKCPNGMVNCGMGCAKGGGSACAMSVISQVMAPLMLAANIATLGMSSAATNGAKAAQTSVKVGKKTYQATSRLGKAFAKVANFGKNAVHSLKSTKYFKVVTQFVDKH